MVGKNESGKTAILNALYRLNPAYGEGFDVSEHYPRWLLTKDRKADVIDENDTVVGTFALSDDDVAAVETVFGGGVIQTPRFTYTRRYNAIRANFSIDHKRAVENALDSVNASGALRKFGDNAKCLEDLRDQLAAETSQLDTDETSIVTSSEIEGLLELLRQRVAEKSSTWKEIYRILQARMPKFFYFSQYSVLPGRVALDDIDTAAEGPAQSDLQTARALLTLAGTTTTSLREDDYEERKAELEAVSNDLTQQVFEYWSQNEQLEVAIDVDKKTVEQSTQYGPSVSAVASHLDIRVKDKRHGFTSNFGQRSAGFQWFFSFLAAFSEFDGSGSVIVLLDEPGLALHAKAQADFLRFIEERLATTVQVVYTTHSPFMVEASKLERVRVVEDKGPRLGTKVSSEVLSVGADTIFPLQAALGYDIAQSLFIGPNNLLVEGTSDFTYLTLIGDYLKSIGRHGLDDAWRILPTGGVNNVPAFVALMGRHLDVTVLVDSGASGMQRLNHLTTVGLLNSKRLLTIGQITGAGQADIEDLFSVLDYLKIYNGAFGVKLLKSKLQPGDRIIDRISRTQGSEFRNHGKPADYLLRNRLTILNKLSDESLDNFEAVIQLINDTRK